MMAQADDKSSAEYQRLTWDALRKSINGLVNKVSQPVLSVKLASRLCAVRRLRRKARELQALCCAEP